MDAVVFGSGISRVGVRRITPDIFWITHCLGDHAREFYGNYFEMLPNAAGYTGHRVVDYPFSAFLIRDEKSLLIDTIAPTQRENTLEAIAFALEGRPLDYILISHIELPHAGNAIPISRRWPGARLVTLDEGDHYFQLHGLDTALRLSPGDILSLGKHRLEMTDALFVDHGFTQWAYEQTTGTLFPSDWGHNLHEPALGQCFQFLDEMLAGAYTEALLIDDIKVNAWYQFPWLAFCDIDKITRAIDAFFERYPVHIFAPSHGNIIRREAYIFVDHLKAGMRQAAEMPFFLGKWVD